MLLFLLTLSPKNVFFFLIITYLYFQLSLLFTKCSSILFSLLFYLQFEAIYF